MINYSSMAFPKPVTLKKKPKKINPIGKRTRDRIKTQWTETEIHNSIWIKRLHNCEECRIYITSHMYGPHCFAHRLSKGMYKQYRYLEENYALVCSIKCHHLIDEKYQGKTEEHINRRNELISYLDNIIKNEAA